MIPTTTHATLSLGERMVLAARLAVIEHLRLSVSDQEHSGHRVVIGGAGPNWVADEELPERTTVVSRRSEGVVE